MREKKTVSISSDGRKLVHEGHAYEPEVIRSLRFDVATLNIHWSDNYSLNLNESRRGPYITGLGSLAKGNSLNVIGDSENSSRAFKVSLRPRDMEKRAPDSGDPAVTAYLGFTTADWEIGNETEWWLEGYVPSVTFSALLESIKSCSLRSVSVAVRFSSGMYTDEPHTPIAYGIKWYLRPRTQDGDLAWPETAMGNETILRFTEGEWSSKALDAIDENPGAAAAVNAAKAENDREEAKESAIAGLRGDVAQLTRTIWKFGWIFIVLAVIAILSR